MCSDVVIGQKLQITYYDVTVVRGVFDIVVHVRLFVIIMYGLFYVAFSGLVSSHVCAATLWQFYEEVVSVGKQRQA